MTLTGAATGAFFLLEKVVHPSPSAFEPFEFANHPYLAVVTFIGWVVALPAGFLAARITGRDPRALWSVELRFRWGYFLIALVPALLFLGAEGIYAIALSDWEKATFEPLNVAALAVIVALAPLQSLSEELFFRGSLVQITGQWFSSAWVAYLLPLLFFLSGHHYGWQGMVSVTVFAVCASFLTHVTGGIEAAAAIHAVGNTFAYAPDAFGVDGVDLATASSKDLAVSVVMTLATTVAVFVVLRRRTRLSGSPCERLRRLDCGKPPITQAPIGITISRVTDKYRELPPPGPAWGGSLMGTSIVARLLVEEDMMFASGIFVAIACVIFAVLVTGFLRHRHPSFEQATMAEWSMFFIGILALGAALSGLTDNGMFRLVAFWVGGPATVVTWAIQLTRFQGDPKFTWGLPLVGPMISASVAGWCAREYGQLYLVLGTALFAMSLLTAVPVFIYVYWATWRGRVDLSGAKSATAWVPLGVVGQSTTALQVLYPSAYSVYYGLTALVIAIPLAIFAMFTFYPNVAKWVDYSPAWWACTFPPGTISMGGHQVALVNGSEWLDFVALTIPVLLIIHWALCSGRFVGWVIEGRKETSIS